METGYDGPSHAEIKNQPSNAPIEAHTSIVRVQPCATVHVDTHVHTHAYIYGKSAEKLGKY